MASTDNKENFTPFISSDILQRASSSPEKKTSKKGRSKSIGPGDLASTDGPKQDAKNRRKSTYVAATKSIISTDVEKAERQAARRRTLANRRVSFAPEATLHTWDVIEFMRDHTTSTDSSDSTRRASNLARSSNGETPLKRSPAQGSDIEEPPSTPPDQEDEPEQLPSSPAPQREMHKKQLRRSSGIPPINFNNPDDAYSSSGMSGSSDVSGSEDEEESEEDEESEDATGTAMSLDMGEDTVRSSESASSTSSSARLEAALRQAAQTAGTRGIEYDEHGDDVSMEIAGEEVTNAFKPWAERVSNEPLGSAALDQENVNPFSPAFKAQVVSATTIHQEAIEEENTGDMSMDVTRAVGGIMREQIQKTASSPTDDATMEMTQAFGKVQGNAHASPTTRGGQKRRRSTTEAGSPGESVSANQSKRRRSSVARSSMGDDTMDLTVAMGAIESAVSPGKPQRRKSVARRRSSGVMSEQDEATMEVTRAFGGVQNAVSSEHTASSFDENEELTMELTTVLGGIKAAEKAAADARPVTPQTSQSPLRSAVNTTPKDQERYMDAPDSGPKKLLTPIFQKQVGMSAEKKSSSSKKRMSLSPAKILESPFLGARNVVTEEQQEHAESANEVTSTSTPKSSPPKEEIMYPTLPSAEKMASPAYSEPKQTPTKQTRATPDSVIQQRLDEQLHQSQPSPLMEKQQRSSPAKAAATPEKPGGLQDPRSIIDSIKLMSTPRKETLKAVTPKKQTPAKQLSPVKTTTPRARPTPKSRANARASPARQLSDDLLKLQSTDKPAPKIHLQQFLDMAGIRFMDLTATKRRLTTAPTPSKARKGDTIETGEQAAETNLESAIVAAACTQPEHDMYQHACHELKHYISEGKKVIKQLEAETYREQPPLLQAYMNVTGERKAALDAQMREMKTHARHRSKEIWYAWRSQLLDDLVKALSNIGEGLLADDETLRRAEEILEQVLPGLLRQQEELQQEAETLEQAAAATSEEEKEELAAARERVVEVDAELEEKRRILAELQQEAQEQDALASDLQDSKAEFAAAIREADRVREACRGVSVDEITALKASIAHLESTTHWSILSASSSPTTITMTYKSQLQLFFHPTAFLTQTNHQPPSTNRPNAPISLTYTPRHDDNPTDLTTTLRFFLQLLRASLQALPQSSTRIQDLLSLVSKGWNTALTISETERRLSLETLTTSRIVSDERLALESTILLPKVKTKVRVAFEILAAVGEGGEEEEGLRLSTSVVPRAWVVYGEGYGEEKMTRFVRERIAAGLEGWEGAVRGLRERLVAQGAKGMRR